jgi:hypothetical protein
MSNTVDMIFIGYLTFLLNIHNMNYSAFLIKLMLISKIVMTSSQVGDSFMSM